MPLILSQTNDVIIIKHDMIQYENPFISASIKSVARLKILTYSKF